MDRLLYVHVSFLFLDQAVKDAGTIGRKPVLGQSACNVGRLNDVICARGHWVIIVHRSS